MLLYLLLSGDILLASKLCSRKPLGILLHRQYSRALPPDCVTCIRVHDKRRVAVRMLEYWAINQSLFQFVERIMAFRVPSEIAVLFCYLVKRFRCPSKVFDETSAVTAKSNKIPHFGNVFWSFPVPYCNEFVFIWCNSLWAQFVS